MSHAADPTADEPITRAVLLDAALRQAKDTGRVEVSEIRILPGYAGGQHVHNGPVLGNIVEGSAICQIEGQPETELRAGDVFYEPEGAKIARFDAGPHGVRFIAYFLLSLGQQAEIRFTPGAASPQVPQ
jgi:quercetin dioxygenase-like cupin family protein